MTRLSKLAVFAGLASTMLAWGPAQAQAPKVYELRFNHVHSPREAFPHKGLTAWAKAVEERTKGGLKIQVFHSAQLGVEEDIIEQIRQGANVGQNTDAARLGNYVPEIAVLNGPYFADSLDDVAKLRRSPTIKKYLDELADKHGLKVLSFSWVQGFRHIFANKPVKSPADLAGLRIRTPPAPIWQESVRAIGATPVAMAFGDIYPGLQQKAVDGIELSYANIPPGRYYEVVKIASETRHIMLMNFEVISAKWFNSLPAEYQQILVEECDKAGEAMSRENAEAHEKALEELKKRGMTIIPEKDVDIAAFRAAGAKAYEVLKIAPVKDAILKEIGR